MNYRAAELSVICNLCYKNEKLKNKIKCSKKLSGTSCYFMTNIILHYQSIDFIYILLNNLIGRNGPSEY